MQAPIQAQTNNRADVLLVTVTDVEFDAVIAELREQFGRTFRRQFIHDKTYFALGEIGGTRTFLVRSEMGSLGHSGATLTVASGIQDLAPSAVVMVGIAFGVDPTWQQLGEILVSRQMFDYDLVRKDNDSQGQRVVISRGDRVTASPRLLDRFRGGRADWDGVKVHFGKVLSGSQLILDRTALDELLELEPEAIGGEMEGAGLYAAAERRKVDWIWVKAIADWADGSKGRERYKDQPEAARNAARFVFHVLKHGGLASRQDRLLEDLLNEAPSSSRVAPPVAPPLTRLRPIAKIAAGLGGLAIFALIVMLLVSIRAPSGNTASVPTVAPATTSVPSLQPEAPAPTTAPATTITPDQVSAPTSVAGTGAILFSDDFDKPSQQFKERDDEYSAGKFIDGKFVITAKIPQLTIIKRIGDYTDAAIEFEATIEGRMTNSTGLMFRSPDRDMFYRFAVDARGRYNLDRVENRNTTSLINWTSSPALNPAGQSNKLRVVTKGNLIELYANDVLLWQNNDDTFTSGKAYLFADSSEEDSVTVRFDNLLVQSVP
jgi:nucleoside phosphorylase